MAEQNTFLQRVLTALLWIGGAVLFFRCLLLPLLPFLLALALSAISEPLVQRFRRRLRVKRSFAAGVVTTTILLLAGGALAWLLIRVIQELQQWTQHLPQLIEQFPALWNSTLDRISRWYAACPLFLRSAMDQLARQLTEEGPSLITAASTWLMEQTSALFASLPHVGLFLVTTVLALYFTALGYPQILSFCKRQLPAAWQGHCRAAARCFRSTMLKWLRSELLLILATFLLLLLGFTLMKLDYALLAAAFVALVDALPVLGTGTVLVPWAIVNLLLGGGELAIPLLLLYAAVTVTHSLLEPRLLAGQVGLPPITALLAMYLGFHFMGVGGMILFPVVLLLLKQFSDAGVIRIWR